MSINPTDIEIKIMKKYARSHFLVYSLVYLLIIIYSYMTLDMGLEIYSLVYEYLGYHAIINAIIAIYVYARLIANKYYIIKTKLYIVYIYKALDLSNAVLILAYIYSIFIILTAATSI